MTDSLNTSTSSFFKIELRVLQSTAKNNEEFLTAVAAVFERQSTESETKDLTIKNLHAGLKRTRDALEAFENVMEAAGGYIDTTAEREALDEAHLKAISALATTDRI